MSRAAPVEAEVVIAAYACSATLTGRLPVAGTVAAQLAQEPLTAVAEHVLGHVEAQLAARDVDHDPVAVLDERDVAAARRLGGGVADGQARSCRRRTARR